MKRQVVPVFVLIALIPLSARGEVGTIKLKDMIRDASAILIGTVEATDGKNATVRVTEVLKGTPGKTLRLNIEQTWECDSSHAVPKETVLLFVERDRKNARNRCYMWGRGRMPIEDLGGEEYARFRGEVLMPEEIKSIEATEPQWRFQHRASLEDLKSYIKKTLESPAEDTNSDKE